MGLWETSWGSRGIYPRRRERLRLSLFRSISLKSWTRFIIILAMSCCKRWVRFIIRLISLVISMACSALRYWVRLTWQAVASSQQRRKWMRNYWISITRLESPTLQWKYSIQLRTFIWRIRRVCKWVLEYIRGQCTRQSLASWSLSLRWRVRLWKRPVESVWLRHLIRLWLVSRQSTSWNCIRIIIIFRRGPKRSKS